MENGSFVGTLYVAAITAALMLSAGATADTDRHLAGEKVMTRSGHEAMAKSYEDAAGELQTRLQEKIRLLEQYQDKSYLYGRHAQDLQAHTHALIWKYGRDAKENMKKAAAHRQMAAGLEENIYCVSTGRVASC